MYNEDDGELFRTLRGIFAYECSRGANIFCFLQVFASIFSIFNESKGLMCGKRLLLQLYQMAGQR
jgi:hypothetical protein